MIVTAVKIDLAGSKVFASSQEKINPAIRLDVLKRLLEISQNRFPGGTEAYPQGTFYKGDGDAVYYVVNKASVALRAAIEFMQDWYALAMPSYPDCRVFMDTGSIDTVAAPGKLELTGRPLENISVFEKGVEAGKIYTTKGFLDYCDSTMAKFVFYRAFESLHVYYVDFHDPRTIADSALVNALFIANPEAVEARERCFELFVVEYLLEHDELIDFAPLSEWADRKSYPLPPRPNLLKLLDEFSFVSSDEGKEGKRRYYLSPERINEINAAKAEFQESKARCVEIATNAIVNETGAKESVMMVDLATVVEDYLCAIFSEVRMMANYFRYTSHLFESGPETFHRFDYVLKRHLPDIDRTRFEDWRTGLLRGLRQATEENNVYISAIFHSILATYYLNRSTKSSPYQEELLKKRSIYVDTNILYASLVPASSYRELLNYIIDKLTKLGVRLKVFPFTVEEYEYSLQLVVDGFRGNKPGQRLLKWNPWLCQEFLQDPGKYLGRIEVCRGAYSITGGGQTTDMNFLDRSLEAKGFRLETECFTYPDDEAKEEWTKLMDEMSTSGLEFPELIEFRYQLVSRAEAVNKHDAQCVRNVEQKYAVSVPDELGPQVMFLTLDSQRLLRLRKKYKFIVGVEQLLEFLLPYLFLSDIPIIDAARFPNTLLSAQLGTMLVSRPPKIVDLVSAYLREPSSVAAMRKTKLLKVGEPPPFSIMKDLAP